jgi:hypothetical protein
LEAVLKLHAWEAYGEIPLDMQTVSDAEIRIIYERLAGFATDRVEREGANADRDAVQENPTSRNASGYIPRQWFDYYYGDIMRMPWDERQEITLPEYPGVTFIWTAEAVTAKDQNGEQLLFDGTPIWSVYFADINGDELPEICATVSTGFGMIDNRKQKIAA